MSEQLVQAVDNLTTQTTALLDEYRGGKTQMVAQVAQAEAAKSQAVSSAAAAKADATAAAAAEVAANAAKTAAQTAASTATEVSGLNTVQEAIALALANAHMYVRTKAHVMQAAEAMEANLLGSGFLEWGKHRNHLSPQYGNAINQGMWDYFSKEDCLLLGSDASLAYTEGTSSSYYPILAADGHIIHMQGVSPVDVSSVVPVAIKFPPAPNGTKTVNTATAVVVDYLTEVDPKYGDIAATVDEASIRAHEGYTRNGDFRNGLNSWTTTSALKRLEVVDGYLVIEDRHDTGDPYLRQDYNLPDGTELTFEVTVTELNGLANPYFELAYGGTSLHNSFTIKKPGTYSFDFTIPADSDNNFQLRIRDINNSGDTFKIKSIFIRDRNEQVITSRRDLAFVEVWHEDVAEKGVIFPNGAVQWSATTSPIGNTMSTVAAGIGQGYTQYGNWDTKTLGYCRRIVDMTTADLAKAIADPKNNLYYDPVTDKLIQIRWRIRVIEGAGNKWRNYLPYAGQGDIYSGISAKAILSKGKLVNQSDLGSNGLSTKYTNYMDTVGALAKPGRFVTRADFFSVSETGRSLAIPLALVQRLNQGAYHPIYNPEGCSALCTAASGGSLHYKSQTLQPVHSYQCFRPARAGSGSQTEAGVYSAAESGKPSGSIQKWSTISGTERPDHFLYYDAIYRDQVEDLRFEAKPEDLRYLLRRKINECVAGSMRGSGQSPFMKGIFKGSPTGREDGLGLYTTRVSGSRIQLYGTLPDGTDITDFAYYNDLVVVHNSTTNTSVRAYVTKKTVDSVWLELDAQGLSLPDGASWDRNSASLNASYFTVAIHSYREPVFNRVPITLLIGDADRLQAMYPNGVFGEWVAQIPDGTSKLFSFPYKRSQAVAARRIYTTDNGATWTEGGYTVDDGLNGYVSNIPSDNVGHYYVTHDTYFTEPTTNKSVLESLDNVLFMADSSPSVGSRLAESLVKGIIQSTGSNLFQEQTVTSKRVTASTGTLTATTPLKHVPNTLNPASEGYLGCKALPTLIRENGLLYLAFFGNALKYSGGSWNDNATVPILANEGITTDDAGNKLKSFCHKSLLPVGLAPRN